MHTATRRASARTTPRRPGRSAVVAAVATLVALVGAACAPTTPTAPPPNPAGLRATLHAGGIELDWTPTLAGQSRGYELQYRAPEAAWVSLPKLSDTTTLFTLVQPHLSYAFRIRAATSPGTTPAEFSPAVSTFYVVPELPIVRIDTDGRAPILDKDNYVRGSMTIDPNGSEFAAYSGTLGIKGRGNSTWFRPKKPYRIKLDAKSPIMGIASSKDWVLLANFDDKSQVRSIAASEISHATDLAWTPTYRPVEVVLNGDYVGAYSLTEAIKVAKNRVDIEEMGPEDVAGEDLTGGYLMEIDERLEMNNEPGWRTTKSVPVVVKDPDPMTPEQRIYIRQHVQKFEDALYSPNFADPVGGYRRYLDVDAFVDHYLVQELTRSGDSFWSSTYFSKDRGDDHLVFGPIWDFDHSLGSAVTPKPQPPEGWYTSGNGPWIRRLFTDPAFVARVGERWDQFQPTFAGLPAMIEALGTELRPAIDNDAARWNYTLAEADTPEYLSSWLTTRIDWIDTSLDAGV